MDNFDRKSNVSALMIEFYCIDFAQKLPVSKRYCVFSDCGVTEVCALLEKKSDFWFIGLKVAEKG